MRRFLLLLWMPVILFAVPWPPHRAPIDPYISGDTFRAHADFAYDEIDRSFDPEKVPLKSTIFVNGELLGEFLECIHPQIQNPYILIVHNSDCSSPGCYRSYLDDPKILAFFTENPDGTIHPKLHPIPIGIENRNWNKKNWEIIEEVKSYPIQKTYLLYCNFNRHTYPSERSQVLDWFSEMPFTYTCPKKPYVEYVRDLVRSQFVLSPRGNGLDCIRTWETLYAGSYPIVRSSPLDPLFENLPVVIVQNWEDITEEFLKQKYKELSERHDYQWEKLTIDYYLKQIDAIRP
jgi:hypothetical protein